MNTPSSLYSAKKKRETPHLVHSTHHDHATLWNTTHVTSQGVNVWEGIELFLPYEGALDSVATPLPVHRAFLHLHAHAQLAQKV